MFKSVYMIYDYIASSNLATYKMYRYLHAVILTSNLKAIESSYSRFDLTHCKFY